MVAVLDVEAELVGAVDKLCTVDPSRLADGETLVLVHRQLERLSAVITRAVAAFDAGRAWDAEGARSASAWLAVRWKRAPELGPAAGGAGTGPAGDALGGGGMAGR